MAFTVVRSFHLQGHTYQIGERFRVGMGKHFVRRLGTLIRRGFVTDGEAGSGEPAAARAAASVLRARARPNLRRDDHGHAMGPRDRRPAGAACKHGRPRTRKDASRPAETTP